MMCGGSSELYNELEKRENARPVIFLDIDGVLNDHKVMKNKYCSINPYCMANFNKILEAFPPSEAPRIVISSAWRYLLHYNEMSLNGFKYLLMTHGMTGVDIIGKTAKDADIPSTLLERSKLRSKQIDNWYLANQSIIGGKAVALDDIPLECKFVKSFQTNGNQGLTYDNVQTILNILRGDDT